MSSHDRLTIEPHPEGSILSIRAHAGARRNAITGVHDGALRVSVTAAPEKGQANRAILEVLSEALAMARSSLKIVSGTTSKQKKVLVADIAPAELERRCQALIRTRT
jgi:uncharacterized protein (TIGR00251 family)